MNLLTHILKTCLLKSKAYSARYQSMPNYSTFIEMLARSLVTEQWRKVNAPNDPNTRRRAVNKTHAHLCLLAANRRPAGRVERLQGLSSVKCRKS